MASTVPLLTTAPESDFSSVANLLSAHAKSEPHTRRTDLERLSLGASLVAALQEYVTRQPRLSLGLPAVTDTSPAETELGSSRALRPAAATEDLSLGLVTEAVFKRKLRGRAEHLRDAALFFYSSHVIAEINTVVQLNYQDTVQQAFSAWEAMDAAATGIDDHQKAIKGLYSALNKALKEVSKSVYGRRAKAVNMRVLDAIYTMHQHSAMDMLTSEDIVTAFTADSEPIASAASGVSIYFEAREHEIKHFRRDQIEELLLILTEDKTRQPRWFKSLSAWHQAYLQKVVGAIQRTESSVPISLKRRLEHTLAGAPSTLRLFGLANFYEHRAHVKMNGREIATVTTMRSACPMPDPKFVKKEVELARLTEANLRQYIFEAIQVILKADGGYADADGVKHLLITELSVLSALGVDQTLTPLNENNLKMVQMTREAMARVKLEFDGPVLVEGHLVQVHLAHTGHPINQSRNVPNGFAALAQSPSDQAAVLAYVDAYVHAQGDAVRASKPLLFKALADYKEIQALGTTRDINDLNVMMFRAALEAIIISEVGGVALIHCKSGQDRAGQVFYQIDAMLEYYARYDRLPNVLRDDDDEFIAIYLAHFSRGHHARVRENGIPHSLGIKEVKNICHPAVFERLATGENSEALKRSTALANISKPGEGGNEWAKTGVQTLGALNCRAPDYREESVDELTHRIRGSGLILNSATIHLELRLPAPVANYLRTIIGCFVAAMDIKAGVNESFPAHLFAKEPGLEAALIALTGAANEPINIATAKIWFANAEALFTQVEYLLPEDLRALYQQEMRKALNVLTWLRKLVINEITPALWKVARNIKGQVDFAVSPPGAIAPSASEAIEVADPLAEITLPDRLKKILLLLTFAAGTAETSNVTIFSRLRTIVSYLGGGNAVYLAGLLRAADKEIDAICFDAPKAPRAGKQSLIDVLGLREDFLACAMTKTGIEQKRAEAIAHTSRKPVSFLQRYGVDLLFILTKGANLSLYGIVLLMLQKNETPSDALITSLTATFYAAITASALALVPRVRELAHLPRRLEAEFRVANNELSFMTAMQETSWLQILMGAFGFWVGDSVGSATQSAEVQVLPFHALGVAAGLGVGGLYNLWATHPFATDITRKGIAVQEVLFSLAIVALTHWALETMGYGEAIKVILPLMGALQVMATAAYLYCEPKKTAETTFLRFSHSQSATGGPANIVSPV